jgi:hypothetical protein
MAIIRRGTRRYFAKVGQPVGSYTVALIGTDRVTLTRDQERVTLELRTAEESEQEEEP